jgi:putative hydrolase of the HAD superfamily
MDNLKLSEIKVVFMDIGGVLLNNGWGHESRQKAAEFFGLNYEEMNARHNFIYNVFEIGAISLDEYLDTLVFYCPRNFSKAEFAAFMYAQSVELPDMLAWAKSWKKTTELPVFALSNESREINAHRIATFGLRDLFDGFFSSCYLGVRKPNPQIFRTAMEIVQVAPYECIYFDDRTMFVDVAKKLGINAVQHQSFEATKKIIESLTKKK